MPLRELMVKAILLVLFAPVSFHTTPCLASPNASPPIHFSYVGISGTMSD